MQQCVKIMWNNSFQSWAHVMISIQRSCIEKRLLFMFITTINLRFADNMVLISTITVSNFIYILCHLYTLKGYCLLTLYLGKGHGNWTSSKDPVAFTWNTVPGLIVTLNR